MKTIISQDSKEAKVLYDLIYNRGFWSEEKRDKLARTEIPALPNACQETVGMIITDIVQRLHAGKGTWESYMKDQRGYSSATTEPIIDFYDNYDVSNVDIKGTFTLVYMDAGDDQDFVLWNYEERDTKLRIKKMSSNTSITG